MSNDYCGICGDKIEEVYRSPVFCYDCDVQRIRKIDKNLKKIKERMDEWEQELEKRGEENNGTSDF